MPGPDRVFPIVRSPLNKQLVYCLASLIPLLALSLTLLRPSGAKRLAWLKATPPLPAYHLRLSDGQGHGSQSPDTFLQLDSDATLGILIQPDDRVDVADETSVACYLVQGGRITRWPIRLERAASGAQQLRAPVRALPGLSPGRWDMLFVIGRQHSMPDSPLGALTDPAEVRILSGHLNIVSAAR